MSDAPTPSDFGLRRYAVLLHSGVDEAHYDFLFETGPDSPLVTFRLSQWPPTVGQTATKLRDHRRAYLTFEGPVPGHRGRVDRVAEGSVRVSRTLQGWVLRHDDGEPFVMFEPRSPEPTEEWWCEAPETQGRASPR